MRLFKTILCILVLFVGLGAPVNAQEPPELINNSEFRPVARQAIDSLYNFNPNAAQRLLEPWKQRYPGHPLWTLFNGIELWWQILADLEDTSHDEQFFNLMGRADYESGRLLSKYPGHADALIIKTISNGYIARQHANRDEWLTSMNKARKAYNAYQYLQEVQPDLPDLKLAEGLKLYYSAYLPEAYPIVKTVSWFLPDGNKIKGLRYLAEAAKSSIFAQAEARYFLGNINLLYENDYPQASHHLRQLYEHYPNNSYYARILVRSYYHMDAFDQALAVINESMAHWEQLDLPYQNVLKEELLTWKGRIYFRRFQYKEAIPFLEVAFKAGKTLERPERRSHHVLAGYYLARCHLQLGHKEEARRYLATVADMETQNNHRSHARELLNKHF